MTIRFTVHTMDAMACPGWMWVVVHDTVDELRAAAVAHGRRVGGSLDFAGAFGCFQGLPFRVQADDETGEVTEPAGRYAGVLRLTPEAGARVVAHECTHAGLAMFCRQHALVLNILDDPEMVHEEALAYTIGDLAYGVTVGLLERGVWEPVT